MPYFIIHGHPNCPNFGHAIIVAQYLAERLPNFEYKKVEVAPREWGEHLLEVNKSTKWYIIKSPLIYKEIHHWGGQKYLIGGLGEFWEYVYCYYGLESKIPRNDLRKLVEDNMAFFEEQQREEAQRVNYVRVLSILGASNLMTTMLLDNLFDIPNLGKKEGMIVKLYDERADDERRRKIIEDTASYYNSLNILGSTPSVLIAETLTETMKDCDVLVIVEDFRPPPGQSKSITYQKCFARMNFLSEAIVESRHRNLRIVLANEGPSCFLATCLVEFCTTVRPSDIVVVTADEGLSYISLLSEKTEVPVCNISGPPVWGFTGMNCFVDIKHTVYKAEVYRPNNRSLTAPRGSTLPLGTIKSELRLMSYLITNHNEFVRAVEIRKSKITKIRERPPFYTKIRSVVSLLTLWYSDPTTTDEIISLGVCSNGCFDIPPGVIFSQPVMLDAKNRWVPFAEFPLIDDTTREEIKRCVTSASKILKEYGLLRHFCRGDVDTCSNRNCQYNIMKCSDSNDDSSM